MELSSATVEDHAGPHCAKDAAVWKLGAHPGGRHHTGAMGGAKLADVQCPKSGEGLCHAGGLGFQEMHAAEDGVDGTTTSDALNVLERVHHSGMGTSQKHDDSVASIEEQRLIVDQGVLQGATLIEEEGRGGILEGGQAWNLTGDEDAIQHFRGPRGPDNPIACLLDDLPRLLRKTDRTAVAFGVAGELGVQGGGMKEELGARGHGTERGQTPGVVIVAMAQDDGLDSGQVDTQPLRILDQETALANIKHQ